MKEVPKELREGMHTAVVAFLKRDWQLLKRNVYEPAVSGSLMADVRNVFEGDEVHFVHPEYDKHGEGDKILNGKAVRPDIIVHHPGDDKSNKLVIELKKGSKPNRRDEKKLMGFTDLNGTDGYRYAFGLFIGFSPGEDGTFQSHLRWFSEGKEILYETLKAKSGIPR